MKYRKKPVVIEAYKYEGDGMEALEWSGSVSQHPTSHLIIKLQPTEVGLFIATLEGEMHVSLGDFIVCGVEGEFYPCKPDIFEKTYEVVNE